MRDNMEYVIALVLLVVVLYIVYRRRPYTHPKGWPFDPKKGPWGRHGRA